MHVIKVFFMFDVVEVRKIHYPISKGILEFSFRIYERNIIRIAILEFSLGYERDIRIAITIVHTQ